MPDDVETEEGEGAAAPETKVELRFRALAADGRQLGSAPFLMEAAVPPPPRLLPPYFGHKAYRPGDKARIVVDAKGVKKGSVKLIVEQQAGSAWQKAAELSAPFQMGSATATWTAPDVPAGPAVKFRVRAIASFGQQASEPIAVERAGQLTSPTFSHAHPKNGAHYDHGDEAVLKVVAKGLDGQKIKFVVEHQQGSAWEPLETLTATVANGEAVARLAVKHPILASTPKLAALQAAKPVQIRFHAELV